MNLAMALNYLRPQVNRILAIAPDKRTHQDAALLEVVLRASVQDFKATHRHKARGTFYEMIGEGKLQITLDKFTAIGLRALDNLRIILYRGEDGALWARPKEEFEDGRFETL